ncbi:MAG TPA: DUF962 domain-containing protein [Candidatus Acidoferrales bacterium]|nr:DUF962 domain-containing protein [Candidatus Acidoferrales bacterium]
MGIAQTSPTRPAQAKVARPSTYDEFFFYYVRQHLNPVNRALHVTGTVVGTGGAIASGIAGKPAYIPAFIALGYVFAWFGHFVFEKNKPATFGYPLWSFVSDYRMLGLLVTGRLGSWLERARSEQHR